MKILIKSILSLLVLLLQFSCEQMSNNYLTIKEFGKIEKKDVNLFEVGFEGGLHAKVTNYGGIITSLSVPDIDGKIEEVILGYDNLDGYLNSSPYFGALIGRFGNRIANGRFELNGEQYQLATNNGVNHLHGGIKGFDKVIWEVIDTYKTKDSIGIKLKYVSPHLDQGYPGKLTTMVKYNFTKNSISIKYWAETDAPTIINLTNHTYFNLSGNVNQDILSHQLSIKASEFLPIDSTLIPSGERRSVKDTPFDFTTAKQIGLNIDEQNLQLTYGKGYDHCWVLDGWNRSSLRKVADLYHTESHRYMEVFTTEPGIQFYSGNFLDGSITGANGVVFNHRFGLCLETQHFPDSPNKPNFPPVRLDPDETYSSKTIYKFSIK